MLADVVVIGGGIVGCSCAFYLAQAGLKVRLVEKDAIGSGASRAGMCHLVTWEEPKIHLDLARESISLYAQLARELHVDIQFRQTGSLSIVESDKTMSSISDMVHRLRGWGVAAQLLSVQEVFQFEPGISPAIAGGVFYADDAQVNPLYATLGLSMAARELGASIDPYTEVTSVELDPGKSSIHSLQTSRGRIQAGSYVLAAGAWSGEIGKMLDLAIPIKPRKGHLVLTAPLPKDRFRVKTIFSAGYLESVTGSENIAVSMNLQQTVNGNLLLGSSRQFVGFDRTVEPRVISKMIQRTLSLFSSLQDVFAIRSWAGLRPYTPDLLPVIGIAPQFDNLYIAAGHEGLGITEGPITGKLISQLVTGQQPSMDIGCLSMERFQK
jgi:glycine/D-amino acid oxidase-like deaminating enzyme